MTLASNQSAAQGAQRIQFGDYQTPRQLAYEALLRLRDDGAVPGSIIEPTCGKGAFILAACKVFPEVQNILGLDINNDYLNELKSALREEPQCEDRVKLQQADFFNVSWDQVVHDLPDPLFIVGNPPWVTNSTLSALGSKNLPEKINSQALTGIDAITGKGNFDISEWMLLRYLEWLQGRAGGIAVLVKTSVARKVLTHAWKKNYPIKEAALIEIDAQKHFRVAVDACLLIITVAPSVNYPNRTCAMYSDFQANEPIRKFGFEDGSLSSDLATYRKLAEYVSHEPSTYIWRSGIKHDSSRVMELQPIDEPGHYKNGFGEIVELESQAVYPLLKSSDIYNNQLAQARKSVIITQRFVGEDTAYLAETAPLTWDYLSRHQHILNARKSVIYRGKPPFSLFGVGDYTFAPWKVAISGFYKSLKFRILAPIDGKPVMVDDTVYFLPAQTEEEAVRLHAVLTSEVAQSLLESMVFWDEKRPITVERLKRLNLTRIANKINLAEFPSQQRSPETPLFKP